jgi:signal transduction histidine kinase/ligand-binding sensor domain-containing protein
VKRAALALALLLTPAAARSERLPFRSYTTAEGLAHDRVGCVMEDSRGFLWFGTPQGLSRFDGYHFATFGPEHGLPGASVSAFMEAGDGEYWVATEAGACRFHAATARCEPQPLGGASGQRVRALLRDGQGRVWLAAAHGLFRSGTPEVNSGVPRSTRSLRDRGSGTEDGRAFHAVTPAGAGQATALRGLAALALGPDGSVWAGGPGGLWRLLPDGGARHYDLGPAAERQVSVVWVDGQGRVWTGHLGGLTVLQPEPLSALSRRPVPPATPARGCVRALASLRPGQTCSVTVATLPRGRIWALTGSADGTVWAGTQNAGLIAVAGGSVRWFTRDQGLSNDAVRALLEDRRGNLWIGTESHGVSRLAQGGFVSYGRDDGLRNTRITTVFGRGGEVYVTSSTVGVVVYRFDGRGFQPVRPGLRRRARPPLGFGVRNVLRDRAGAWWIGTRHGLTRFDGAGGFEGLDGARPQARYAAERGPMAPVFEDSRGAVWTAARPDGRPTLLRVEPSTEALSEIALPREVAGWGWVTALADDRAGGLWMGFARGGLLRRARGRFTRLEVPGHPAVRVAALHVDRAGRLWVAASQGGLGRIEQPDAARPEVVRYGRREGLASEVVHCLSEDRWGRIYAGTNAGVDRLDPATSRVRHYGTADGLAAGEVTSAFADDRGRIWFGTMDGVSTLTPQLEPPAVPPRVHLTAVRVAGIDRPVSALGETRVEGLELSPDERQVEIEYAGLGTASGEQIRYRHRLEGADRDWGPPTEQRTANFARLAPGSYRFLVQAQNGDGTFSTEPATVSFRIRPPVWRRWWFLSLAGLAVTLLAHRLHRYRVARLLELERVRTRIASDLHDDIGSNLTQIAILGEVAQRRLDGSAPEVAEPLALIGSLSRETVDSMSDIVWAIDPHKDRLGNLAHRMRRLASDTLGARGIALSFHADEAAEQVALGADVRRQVYLIFKEGLHNAARHAACTRVEVGLRLEAGRLELELSDDGTGFDPACAGDGHGLRSLQQRARDLGGTLEVSSSAGTRLVLRVPYRGRPTQSGG